MKQNFRQPLLPSLLTICVSRRHHLSDLFLVLCISIATFERIIPSLVYLERVV